MGMGMGWHGEGWLRAACKRTYHCGMAISAGDCGGLRGIAEDGIGEQNGA